MSMRMASTVLRIDVIPAGTLVMGRLRSSGHMARALGGDEVTLGSLLSRPAAG